ncbi:MAG TPA: hypothetical protein VL993_03910 [Stellaceae bacterium]|nr:hypothetical protein [Stellaceae bacterium]
MSERAGFGLLAGVFAVCLFVLASCGHSPPLLPMSQAIAIGSGMRVAVPIYRHRLDDNNVRFWVWTRIGNGAPIETFLDTGSVGLRVLTRAAAAGQYETLGLSIAQAFAGDDVLVGPLANAIVGIGDATTSMPVTVQIVTSVRCDQIPRGCAAAQVSFSDYGIGGDGFRGEGFDAMLGISMRHLTMPEVVNPLLAAGGQRWIVILPRPDTFSPGTLIINPDANDLAGFHKVRVAFRKYRDSPVPQETDMIANCPDRPFEAQRSCEMTLLDSGSFGGHQLFYYYAVLFDDAQGTISVKPR